MYILHPLESPAQNGTIYKLTQRPRKFGSKCLKYSAVFCKIDRKNTKSAKLYKNYLFCSEFNKKYCRNRLILNFNNKVLRCLGLMP